MSFYDLTINDIEGREIILKNLSGRKIMLVNVASECGYTAQYTQLQELHREFPNISIIGMPCNDFGNQEPGTEKEIATFCSSNFGVEFIMTEKINISSDPHPIIQWLTQRSHNGKMDVQVAWNFFKFIVDENGELQSVFPSAVSPLDDRILKDLNITI